MLFVGVAGLAVVLALLLVALFPDSEPDPPPAPGGQSVVAADTTRWEAVHAALTQIRVEAPTVLPGGYELASLSQWRPRWSSTEAIWSWLLHGPAGSWIVVTADPLAMETAGITLVVHEFLVARVTGSHYCLCRTIAIAVSRVGVVISAAKNLAALCTNRHLADLEWPCEHIFLRVVAMSVARYVLCAAFAMGSGEHGARETHGHR